MGSSSILAGCALVSLGKCLGLCFNDEGADNNNGVTKAVLLLEQLLTTGGGWQDQIGGLYGGLKLGESEIHKIPMQLKVNQYNIGSEIENELNQRMLLLFTGQPRLAKNILRNVLRQWVSRKRLIVKTVNNLVKESHESVQAVNSGNIDKLGSLLSSYWTMKKTMAGSQSGVEPPDVKKVIDLLTEKNMIVGASLCGAGGGGFLVALTKKGKNYFDAKQCIEYYAESYNLNVDLFSWYDCQISVDGVSISTLSADESIYAHD